MRTRRSPRNQERLWRYLTPPASPGAAPPSSTPRCWDCARYPAGGRARGTCALTGETVAGITENRPCFTRRAR